MPTRVVASRPAIAPSPITLGATASRLALLLGKRDGSRWEAFGPLTSEALVPPPVTFLPVPAVEAGKSVIPARSGKAGNTASTKGECTQVLSGLVANECLFASGSLNKRTTKEQVADGKVVRFSTSE